ncbi:MAG TPA: family 20 glycosylhydrolase [Magnetospirillaceae bacterium]|nr:family 20 glycosylhydrolase [Magnetospirillaceae bacterium]
MRRSIGDAIRAACLALAVMAGPLHAEPASLLPRPLSDRPADGSFTVSAATPVVADAHDKAAQEAAHRFTALLADSGAVALKDGAGANAIRFVTDKKIAGDEAYRLAVTPQGITISASHPAGLFYGAVSLWQLLTAEPGAGPVTLAARIIDDKPRFAWRGLLLDSARHVQSTTYIKHFLDWMAALKFNVFHWHLTDDEGWRIEIKRYPLLTGIGAWRVPAGPAAAANIDPATGKPKLYGGFYSQDEIRDIVAYAAARHITILPEIDMPGHATAAIAAYPALGTQPVPGVSADWGQFYNLYNVDDSTFTFLENVLTEVMALFPGQYIHVGGDEVLKDQWKASPAAQAKMKALGLKDEDALQSWFIARIEKFLEAHGRHLIGWDEILEGGIAPHATVMSWRGIDGALAAARQGHDTVLSPWPLLYFDNRQGSGVGEPPGRGKVVSIEDVYDFDPMPPALAPNERHHVLGLQANTWTEHIRTEDRVTRMVFPRAAAVAEVGWSPAASHDWGDFSARLAVERARYARLGLADDKPVPPPAGTRLYSQQLKTCSDKLVISLEDDAPVDGQRAVFLIDLENPCWTLPQADLSSGKTLVADIGQVPFNFQIGPARDEIHLKKPRTPEGELEVRADGCDGEPIAVLPLAPAAGNFATTTLRSALPALPGRHDLCFTFTGTSIDPIWAINWIDFETAQGKP